MPNNKRQDSPSNFTEIAAKLEAAADDAIAALHSDLFDSSAAIRIRAAVAILTFGSFSTEAIELERRVRELERVKWKK